MKRLFLILSAISLLLLSSCANSEPSNAVENIHETLVVNADLPKDVPANVSTYKVSYKNFDSDVLLEIFNMKSISLSERDAFGQRFESGNSTMCIYDDKGVLNGGFFYATSPSAAGVIKNWYNTYYEADLLKELQDKALDNFSDIKALSFLKDIGLEELKVDRGYHISGEELIEFMKASDDYTEQDIGNINPEADYSLLFLAQCIDGIPLMDSPWGTAGKNQTYTIAEVTTCENQMIDSRFASLCHVEQEISNDKIISPEKALNAFVNDYNKKFQFDTTTIENISLKYVVTIDKEGMYAQPAYVFEYEYEAKTDDSSEKIAIEETKILSAVTGEFMLSVEVGI